MARRQSNRKVERGFIWLPREADVASDITIDGVSVLTDYISSEFTRAVSPEIGHFKINLINADGKFSNVYSGGEEVILKVDFGVGATQRFIGKIDSIKNKRGAYEVLEVSGGHLSSELLDLTVTAEYSGEKSCDAILKELVDEYLTGYTYTNVGASTVSPNIKWSNKPFWSAVEDICRLAVATDDVTNTKKRFDCYVDDDLDFHFFAENSVENNNEAIVWNDTMISLEGFGERQTLTKNKIIVYGDDGTGLPILRETSNDATPWLKEQVITDTNITTEDIASDIATASLGLQVNEDEGKANCFILPSLQPGEKIWVSDPTMKITKQVKVVKYTHTYPMERTQVILVKDRNVPSIFRDQMLKDLAQDDIVNPHRMTKSINFMFNDFSNLSTWDPNIEITGGKVKLSSGSTGEVFSSTLIQSSDISQVHLLVVGEKITTAIFKISTDGGTTLETISANELNNITPGKDLVFKLQINDSATEIDSIALLIR